MKHYINIYYFLAILPCFIVILRSVTAPHEPYVPFSEFKSRWREPGIFAKCKQVTRLLPRSKKTFS